MEVYPYTLICKQLWVNCIEVLCNCSEDKSRFSSTFVEELKEVAKSKFAWKPTDNVEKKVAECVKQLKDTLEKRRLVNISLPCQEVHHL